MQKGILFSAESSKTVKSFIEVICPIIVKAGENAGPAETQPAERRAESKDHNWLDYSFLKGGFQLYKSDKAENRLTFGGEIFARYAYWNWFEGPSHDNEYSYPALFMKRRDRQDSDVLGGLPGWRRTASKAEWHGFDRGRARIAQERPSESRRAQTGGG